MLDFYSKTRIAFIISRVSFHIIPSLTLTHCYVNPEIKHPLFNQLAQSKSRQQPPIGNKSRQREFHLERSILPISEIFKTTSEDENAIKKESCDWANALPQVTDKHITRRLLGVKTRR
jgi:hypothetical protein